MLYFRSKINNLIRPKVHRLQPELIMYDASNDPREFLLSGINTQLLATFVDLDSARAGFTQLKTVMSVIY